MIRFENVAKKYDDGTEAIEDLSFEIPRGKTVTLVGPSGCGKTTTMKMVNALVEPTNGRIFVEDTPIDEREPIELRRKVGYVIQEIGLFEHMTVGKNIGLVPNLIGWDEDRIDARVKELMELVRLPGISEKYPSELSGGQRQRVGVARALAAEPKVLLMDEPFGALDPITREELQDEFLAIQSDLDVTIVFVTHDVNEALKMGDRVAVLRDGELVQYDAPRDLLANPSDEFVEGFLGEDRLFKQLRMMTVREVMSEETTDDASVAVDTDDDLQVAMQAILYAPEDYIAVRENGQRVGTLTKTNVEKVVGADASTRLGGIGSV